MIPCPTATGEIVSEKSNGSFVCVCPRADTHPTFTDYPETQMTIWQSSQQLLRSRHITANIESLASSGLMEVLVFSQT